MSVMMKEFEKLKFGSKDALAGLYTKTAPHIYALLFRRLANEEDAQTVMKIVYATLWTNRHAADAPSNLNELRALAHREAIKYIVTNNLQPQTLSPNALTPIPPDGLKPNTPVNEDLRQAYLEGRTPPSSKLKKSQMKGNI